MVNTKQVSSTSPPINTTPPTYATVDSGASATLVRSADGPWPLTDVLPMQGQVETAMAGADLVIVAGGHSPSLGPAFVCPDVASDLVSFHGLESQGFAYGRHATDSRLREWSWQGTVIPSLTFCVYANNIGLLHPDGAAHVYPQDFPEGGTGGAYRSLHGPLSLPLLSPDVPVSVNGSLRSGVDPSLDFSSEESGEAGPIPAPINIPVHKMEGSFYSIKHLLQGAFRPVLCQPCAVPAPVHVPVPVPVPCCGDRHHPLTVPVPVSVPVTVQAQDSWVQVGPRRVVKRVLPNIFSAPERLLHANRFSALVEEEDEEDEEDAGEAEVAVTAQKQIAPIARRATKLWSSTAVTSSSQVVGLLHAAGHMGVERLVGIVKHSLWGSWPEEITEAVIRKAFPDNCRACIQGQSRVIRHDRVDVGPAVLREDVPEARAATLGRKLGDLVAIDLLDFAGADENNKADDNRYIMTATDCSEGKFVHCILLTGKCGDSLLGGVQVLKSLYERYGHKLRGIRADGDFTHKEEHFRNMGIVPQWSIPHESETNGRAERTNQTIAGHLRAMMYGADLACPRRWDLALDYFVLLWNATSVAGPGLSSFQQFYHRRWNFLDVPLLPWGVRLEAFKNKVETLKTQEARTAPGFFVGISPSHYRGVLFLPLSATKPLPKRSYWALGDASMRPVVVDDTLPDTWTKDHHGLEFIHGSRRQEEDLLIQSYELRDMAVEEQRSRAVVADLAARILAEEVEQKRLELEEKRKTAATKAELVRLAKELKKLEREQAARVLFEARELRKTRLAHEKAMAELRRNTKVAKAIAEAAERRADHGSRQSARGLQPNRQLAHLAAFRLGVDPSLGFSSEEPGEAGSIPAPAITYPVDDMCRFLEKGEAHPALSSLSLLQSWKAFRSHCVTVGRPEFADDVLVDWGTNFRAALARGTSLERVSFLPDPRGWKQMLAHPKAEEFLKAVDIEMSKLEGLGAGTAVRGGRGGVPLGEKMLRSSFVFVTKRFADTGEIEKYKARLVADGSSQTEEDTHAPTVGGTSLRILFAIAAKTGAKISKLDVESAFLIEAIDKPTYVVLPAEYCNWKGTNRVVWKLLRSLYGLQQAPRLFWLGMKKALVGMGFRSSDHDPCIFVRREADGTTSYIATHVDDCAVVSSSVERNRSIRDALLTKYAGIKWDDRADTFVGMAITYGANGSITLSQPAYVRHLLNVLGVKADGVTFSPVRTVGRAVQEENVEEDLGLVKWLRLAVGLVQFLTMTRMEVSLPLNLVARQMHRPTASVKADMLHILHYLANRPDDGLVYRREGEVKLSCWVDASWQSEVGNNSRTGFALALGANSGVVQSYSKVQSYAALSSQHSEIIAMTEAARAVRHVRMLLEDMGYEQTEPTPVHEDNVGTLAFAKGTCPLEKTKHIANRDRYCREAVNEGIIAPLKIGTKVNPVDGLTKTVGRNEQESLREFLQSGKLLLAKRATYVYPACKKILDRVVQFII